MPDYAIQQCKWKSQSFYAYEINKHLIKTEGSRAVDFHGVSEPAMGNLSGS